MVFKSDKQRKKVMALLRGNTKSEVNPQVVGRINPSSSHKVIIRPIAFKDFKEDFDADDLNRAAKAAAKIKGSKLMIIMDFAGQDSDALFVTKGISQVQLEKFSNKFPRAISEGEGEILKGSVKEITQTLRESEQRIEKEDE